MKHVILLYSMLLLILVAFAIEITINVKNEQTSTQEFTYNKHQYIYFPNKGVVHNPECKKCILNFD